MKLLKKKQRAQGDVPPIGAVLSGQSLEPYIGHDQFRTVPEKYVKIRSLDCGFLTMLKIHLRDPERLQVLLNEWYAAAYGEPLKNSSPALEVILKIRYRLLYNGYLRVKEPLPPLFYKNYRAIVQGIGTPPSLKKTLDNCEYLKSTKKIIINPILNP